MTERELEEHLEKFEEQLLIKVTQISNHKRSWLYQNVGTITSTLIMLVTIAVAWGVNAERISNLIARQMASDQHIQDVASQVRDHHEDFTRHVDADWKNRMMAQLDDIRNLVTRHMARDVR